VLHHVTLYIALQLFIATCLAVTLLHLINRHENATLNRAWYNFACCFRKRNSKILYKILKSKYAYGSSCLPLYNTPLITTFYRMSPLNVEIHVASCQSTTAVCQVTFGFCVLPLIHSRYLMHEEKMNE
jgi:hypothetical protein